MLEIYGSQAMIDPGALFAGSLWVLGLAIVLAAWSLAEYHARDTGARLGEILQSPAFQSAFTGKKTISSR